MYRYPIGFVLGAFCVTALSVLATPGDFVFNGIATFVNTGLHILDTGGDHDLIIVPGTDLGADRQLTFTTGDVARTLTFEANATVSQDYSTDGSVQFGDVTVGNTGLVVGASTPFSDAAGSLTLQNVDVLEATTETTIEAAIDTLANLTSVQGQTVSLAGALTVEAGGLTGNQDVSSDATGVTFGELAVTTKFTVPTGTDLPATCAQGEIFMDTDDDSCADVGGGTGTFCGCAATNTWEAFQ